MGFHHRGNCGCPKRIVHPTRNECVHCCTESVVEHVHPVHTTVVNHHLERNRHIFPHSTSVKTDPKCVDEFGGSCQVPAKKGPGCNCGCGMKHGGFGGYGYPSPYPAHQYGHHGHHHPGQGHYWGNQYPGNMNNWKKSNYWC